MKCTDHSGVVVMCQMLAVFLLSPMPEPCLFLLNLYGTRDPDAGLLNPVQHPTRDPGAGLQY
jgi:hypothetical protein